MGFEKGKGKKEYTIELLQKDLELVDKRLLGLNTLLSKEVVKLEYVEEHPQESEKFADDQAEISSEAAFKIRQTILQGDTQAMMSCAFVKRMLLIGKYFDVPRDRIPKV